VKRQYQLRTRTSYIPCVETPSSVIILRLIDFLRGARDTRVSRPSLDRSETRTIHGRADSRDSREDRKDGEYEREKKKDEKEETRQEKRHARHTSGSAILTTIKELARFSKMKTRNRTGSRKESGKEKKEKRYY